jgi:thiol-disulfide isomerase/thioredoxin
MSSANLYGMKQIATAVGVVALAVALIVGLSQAGSSEGGKSGGTGKQLSKAAVSKELAGAPPELAALHEQANELLDGGPRAFKKRLAELRGHPVVVNKWASWCGPCRAEFPHFSRLSVALGKRVAFLGVDSTDNYEDAARFLAKNPVTYPSYKDGDNTIAQVFNGSVAFPTTAFYTAAGKLSFVHQGQYQSEADLRRDIRRYALQ